jgi:ribosomal protein L11 methyltransferase
VIRLALRVRRAQAELVLAELLELAPSGVEEVDRGETIEYAVYGAPGELPALGDLRAVAGGALVEVSTSEVGDDWLERWREFHRPLVLGGGALAVRAPWHEPTGARAEVVIDPGQAFGTGAHITTRLCLEALLDAAAAGARGALVDVGCGSGVLAIAAARLGFTPVAALDHDPAAVQATRANARANGVEVRARRLDLRRDALPALSGVTVTANLLRPLLLTLAERLGADALGAPRLLIASGLLAGEADEIAAAFATHAGLIERARQTRGEWAALVLEPGG